ncbi:hypothetical protein MO867_12300 [Microbulbifer sp. OS29]|uniref:Uncharacterized protein n=1 Tax=Microbulbifer okhotskensis TaxID=2926617 RepID=A0A9X2J509_9GAMM|nr:hypothetical protein [Microbulbifer okhotskensis]MCO1335112.1 hypothetical protein [Microbulbifer okhotskensis]
MSRTEIDIRPPQNFGKVVSRHRTAKMVAGTVGSAAYYGTWGAQTATGATLTGLATGTAVATSATGIGLIVAGTALSVGYAGLAARSAYKTHNHLNALKKIYASRKTYDCPCQGSIAHDYVSGQVLPYIIQQKTKKLHRKMVESAPGISTAEYTRKALKNIYKRTRGTLGKKRTFAAEWLAQHLISHDCELANAIVAELYSEEEMLWIRTQDNDVVAPLLELKLKSV